MRQVKLEFVGHVPLVSCSLRQSRPMSCWLRCFSSPTTFWDSPIFSETQSVHWRLPNGSVDKSEVGPEILHCLSLFECDLVSQGMALDCYHNLSQSHSWRLLLSTNRLKLLYLCRKELSISKRSKLRNQNSRYSMASRRYRRKKAVLGPKAKGW